MKITTFLAAALILSPLTASAADPIETQWTATFEQMIEVHQAIKSITNDDGSAKKGSEQAVKVLTQRFKELRAALTAADEKAIQARSSKSIVKGKADAGRAAGSGPAWSSVDGKSDWTDEADFKESISGGPYRGKTSPKKKKKKRVEHVEIDEQPVGKGYWENPDDWKSGF